jgi:hypothetical protein
MSSTGGGGCDVAVLAGGYAPYLLDFRADENSYRYRMGGQHDGDKHIKRCDFEQIISLWREAGNAVQWRAPR